MPRTPAYACALLIDSHGRLLLERRPGGARHAPGRLTCFGGRIESGETVIAALRRELQEELGWTARPAAGHVDLYVADAWIARFCAMDPKRVDAVVDRGRSVVALPPGLYDHTRISPWHRAVLRAWRTRRSKVSL